MEEQVDNRPIGVFDSGLGGLTVVSCLLDALPGEDIVYFGDTGRVPYGTRSASIIERYARQDEKFLLQKGVKTIIAACGTVSSVAAHTGAELPVPFVEVVGPAARRAAQATRSGRIGVIGTPATVRSASYEKKLKQIDAGLEVFQQACALFVPLVEAGWIGPDDSITQMTARRYLEPLRDKGIDTLILGCTHYPLIKPIIEQVMGEDCVLINAGHAAATAAAWDLCERQALNERRSGGRCTFYVSDRVDNFSRIASLFLGRDVDGQVEHVEFEA